MLHQRQGKNRENGVSEVVGATLLISIVVISVAVISVMVLSPGTPHKIPALDAVISNIDRNVYVYHDGGDMLQKGEIIILVNGQDKTSSFAKNSVSDWSTWSVGESLVYTAPGSDPISNVKIIYTSGTGQGLLSSAEFGPARHAYAGPGNICPGCRVQWHTNNSLSGSPDPVCGLFVQQPGILVLGLRRWNKFNGNKSHPPVHCGRNLQRDPDRNKSRRQRYGDKDKLHHDHTAAPGGSLQRYTAFGNPPSHGRVHRRFD